MIAVAWMLTRDTNAVTALVAVMIAVPLWRLHRHLQTNRWAVALVISTVVAAGLTIWSVGVPPTTPTGLSRFQGWQPEILARGTPSMINNVAERVLRDPDGRAFFIDHGLPQAKELERARANGPGDPIEMVDPSLSLARTWIATHGTSVYARWLLSRPLARMDEFVSHLPELLSPGSLATYMPDGWRPDAGIVGRHIHKLVTSETILIGLMILAPILIRRARAHPLAKLSSILIASGAVGGAAAYYGDAIEIPRHCYGSGQQIVFGLFVAIIAWLDRTTQRPDVARI